MRKTLISALAVSTLALGGCATGYGYNNDPLGGIFGGILGGGGDRYDDRNVDDFERAAIQACGDQASRYGRVQITDVRRDGRDIVVVRGRLDVRDRSRDEFACAFRSDGRIVDFDLR